MEIREHEITMEVKAMGVDELEKIEKELPNVEKIIQSVERDVDEVREEFHLSPPTEKDPEKDEGYNAHYLDIMARISRDPETIEFTEFINGFSNMTERINAEILQEGTAFEEIHPKHAIIVRLAFALYEKMKELDAAEKEKKKD